MNDNRFDNEMKRIENNITTSIVKKDDVDLYVVEPLASYIVKEVCEWIFVFFLAFVISILLNRYVIETTEVIGESMSPTLIEGEKLFLNKFIYDIASPKRGDIVVFIPDNDSKNYVKRIIALPGETIDIKDNKVYIDGIELKEEYLNNVETYTFPDSKTFPYTLGNQEYFAMGDNRENSFDCRSSNIGALTRKKMRGRAFCRVYPFDKIQIFKKVNYNYNYN